LGQPGEKSAAVVAVLLILIFTLFVLQIGMQEVEVSPAVPRGGDVAVMGADTAALISALEASQEGALVYLFLQGEEPAGDASFLVEGGLAAPSTPLQREHEIELDEEKFELMLREKGGGMNTPSLLRSFVGASGELYRWAEELGGVSFDRLPDPERHPYHHLSSHPGAGTAFREHLLDSLGRAAVFVREETVRDILLCPAGEVKALLLENRHGEKEIFYTRALILAGGGYSGNLQRWNGYLTVRDLVSLRPGQDGRGLELAESLGAEVIQAGFINKPLLLYDPSREQYHRLPPEPWEDAYIFNSRGQSIPWAGSEREEIDAFINNSPPGEGYLLTSEERASPLSGYFRRFWDLEEAAREFSLQYPAEARLEPPYCIAFLRVGVDYTLGGAAVGPRGEVIGGDGPIGGLYAAGEIAGGLHGKAMLPGMPLSEAIFLGKTSGQSAAAHARR